MAVHSNIVLRLAALNMLLVMLGMSACDGGRLFDDPALPFINVRGKVSLGPVSGATVRLYCMQNDGSAGQFLGEGTTGADGSYSLDISPDYSSCNVVAYATGGSYAEEANGASVAVGGQSLRVVRGFLDNSVEDIAITPLTEIAAQRFDLLKSYYPDLSTDDLNRLIGIANGEVAVAAGLDQAIDITTTIPSDPSSPNSDKNSDENLYALVLAGFSRMAVSQAQSSLGLAQTLAPDFQMGSFSFADWTNLNNHVNDWLVSAQNTAFVAPDVVPSSVAAPAALDPGIYPAPGVVPLSPPPGI